MNDMTRRWLIMNDEELTALAVLLAYYKLDHDDPDLWGDKQRHTIAHANRLITKYYNGLPVAKHPNTPA